MTSTSGITAAVDGGVFLVRRATTWWSGSALERAATASGFRAFELVATLPGEPLYVALGFSLDARLELELPDGVRLPVARLTRAICAAR